jgi:hypothetical protein
VVPGLHEVSTGPLFRRDWTTIGEAAYLTSEDVRARVTRVLDGLQWDTPIAVAGDGWVDEVKVACKTFGFGPPRRITFSEDLRPHRLYAVESDELNGVVRYYVLNMHGEMFVLAADFYPNDYAQAAPKGWTL